jgi:hypothetical protein
MPLATKQKCPTCGAKNPPDSERCTICTRALHLDNSPEQHGYAEIMYAQPVRDTEQPEHWIRPAWIFAFLAVLMVWCNFQYWGHGPDWAHRPELTANHGGSWRTVSGVRGFSISFPADARIDAIETPTGAGTRVASALDGRWITLPTATSGLGRTTAARSADVVATVVATVADAPEALTNAASISAVQSALPGVVLASPKSTVVPNPAYGTQVDVTGRYTGGVGRTGEGPVSARVIAHEGRIFVIATFGEGDLDQSLQDRLVAGFRPVGVLVAPDRDR